MGPLNIITCQGLPFLLNTKICYNPAKIGDIELYFCNILLLIVPIYSALHIGRYRRSGCLFYVFFGSLILGGGVLSGRTIDQKLPTTLIGKLLISKICFYAKLSTVILFSWFPVNRGRVSQISCEIYATAL